MPQRIYAAAWVRWRWLAVIGLVGLTALLGTEIAQGQGGSDDIPHQFFGSVDSGSAALLDGGQAADGLSVTAWNAADAQVGSAVIQNGTWLIDVSPQAATTARFRIGTSTFSGTHVVVSEGFTEVALDVRSQPGTDPPPPPPTEPQSLRLVAGFNEIVWSGSANLVAPALASISGQYAAVFQWNNESQSWRTFRPDAPSFLNDLVRLTTGAVYWIFTPNGATLSAP